MARFILEILIVLSLTGCRAVEDNLMDLMMENQNDEINLNGPEFIANNLLVDEINDPDDYVGNIDAANRIIRRGNVNQEVKAVLEKFVALKPTAQSMAKLDFSCSKEEIENMDNMRDALPRIESSRFEGPAKYLRLNRLLFKMYDKLFSNCYNIFEKRQKQYKFKYLFQVEIKDTELPILLPDYPAIFTGTSPISMVINEDYKRSKIRDEIIPVDDYHLVLVDEKTGKSQVWEEAWSNHVSRYFKKYVTTIDKDGDLLAIIRCWWLYAKSNYYFSLEAPGTVMHPYPDTVPFYHAREEAEKYFKDPQIYLDIKNSKKRKRTHH